LENFGDLNMTTFRSNRPEIKAEEQEPPPSGLIDPLGGPCQPIPLKSSNYNIQSAESFFGLQHWSQNTLGINKKGNLALDLDGTSLDLSELAQHLSQQKQWPVLLRFPALIKKNITAIQQAFYNAIEKNPLSK
jgi:hypothetical protein